MTFVRCPAPTTDQLLFADAAGFAALASYACVRIIFRWKEIGGGYSDRSCFMFSVASLVSSTWYCSVSVAVLHHEVRSSGSKEKGVRSAGLVVGL